MKRVVQWMIRITVVVWLVAEGIAIYTPEPEDMISQVIWAWVSVSPFTAFCSGVVIGGLLMHFFWQSDMVYEHYRKKREVEVIERRGQ
jgi:hypothetical protein